jgi:hypothetical protein
MLLEAVVESVDEKGLGREGTREVEVVILPSECVKGLPCGDR